jgi:hypothetical protein
MRMLIRRRTRPESWISHGVACGHTRISRTGRALSRRNAKCMKSHRPSKTPNMKRLPIDTRRPVPRLKVSDRGHVRGIGVSQRQHRHIALEESGAVVRPADLCCDTTTARETDELSRAGKRRIPTGSGATAGRSANRPGPVRTMQRCGRRSYCALTGAPISASMTPSNLARSEATHLR